MSELSPRARAVLEAARRAPCQPPQASLDRLEQGVLVGLAATAGKATGGTAAASALLGKVVASTALVLFGAVVGAAIVWRPQPIAPALPAVHRAALSPDPQPLADEAGSPASIPTLAPPPAVPANDPDPDRDPDIRPRNPSPKPAPVPETRNTPRPPPTFDPPPEVPAAPTGDLSAELALLRTAMQHLDALAWNDTLATLDQHDKEFPRGALRDEADVLRVLALCGLERVPEASNLAAQVHARAPRSPVLSRLTASCVDP